MYINSKNKQLQLEPLRGIITQGEKLADTVTFALPNVYGNLTLSSLGWSIRATSEKNTLATASLTVSVMKDKCLLSWEVSSDFTAISGALSLMLVGTDGDGKIVIKFPGDSPIWVRDSETGEYSPPEDAIENALNGLQSAEEALQNAIEALLRIGVNLKILGWYSTLEALQSGVTNPSPGDIYGVGDPTVLYVWTGSAWTQLPGVFVQSSGYNPQLLDNAYFVGGGSQQSGGQLPVNQMGKTSYSGTNQYTIDRWKISPINSVPTVGTLTIQNDGIHLENGSGESLYFNQIIPDALSSALNGKTVTLSFLVSDVSGTWAISEYSKSGKLFSSPGLIDCTFLWDDTVDVKRVQLWSVSNAVGSVTVSAAKLELGAKSTLASLVNGEWVLNDPPPNFQQELAKCQYYQRFIKANGAYSPFWIGSSSSNAVFFRAYGVQLRVTPTLTASGNFLLRGYGGSIPLSGNSWNAVGANEPTISASGLSRITASQIYQLLSNNDTDAYILLDANL